MEQINIEPTKKTPGITFDPSKGFLEVTGRSIPENAIDFYKPLISSLNEYAKKPLDVTNVNVKLEYFNTSSSKCILDMFKSIEVIHKNNLTVNINWFYEDEDEDMLETGEYYEDIIKIPFKMVVLDEE